MDERQQGLALRSSLNPQVLHAPQPSLQDPEDTAITTVHVVCRELVAQHLKVLVATTPASHAALPSSLWNFISFPDFSPSLRLPMCLRDRVPIPISKRGPYWGRIISSSLLVTGSGIRPNPVSAWRGSALIVVQGGATAEVIQ